MLRVSIVHSFLMLSGILLKRATTIFTTYSLITIWVASNFWILGASKFFFFSDSCAYITL